MQNSTQAPVDILHQFDQLLKNHSILVSDRENLTKLFENVVDLCTQTTKAKLKAAIKAATQESKPKAAPKTKAQPKTKTQEIMVGPEGAADAPMLSDTVVPAPARGRGRPRKNTENTMAPVKSADEKPNSEPAEKKRRGRPKKDKSVTISSNDDEDALIEQMMADVASMQKDEPTPAPVAVVPTAASQFVDDDETDTDDEMSPVLHPTSSQVIEIEVEADVPSVSSPAKTKSGKAKVVKEPKPKAVKEPKPKAVKEPKAVEPKAVKPKAAKESKSEAVKPNAVMEEHKQVEAVHEPLASFSKPMSKTVPKTENYLVNGTIYLQDNFPTRSFSWNGKTYLRTEMDNVYDNITFEMVGVWDHVNREVIHAFDDDDEMYFSGEE
jgi:hypothetical protein